MAKAGSSPPYYNSCQYFNQHCLCFYIYAVVKSFHLWFNLTPLQLFNPFECKQSLQQLLRQYCARSSKFYPPPCYQGFIGMDLITTTGSSATFTPLTNPCLPTCLCLVLKKRTRIKASLVKLTFLFAKPSVVTCVSIRTLGIGTFCNLAPNTCQNRFTRATFRKLAKPSFTPYRCQQRTWIRIVFPPMRRHSFLSNCRNGSPARQTKKGLKGPLIIFLHENYSLFVASIGKSL